MKLKQKDLKDFRYDLWCDQSHICPLCLKKIKDHEAVLDHCHTEGHVRRVLHRQCNSVEGKIMYWAKRSGSDPIEFLKKVIEYQDLDYSNMPIHPKHLTEVEKEIKKLKRRQKQLKTQRGRERLQVKIDALEAMEDRE